MPKLPFGPDAVRSYDFGPSVSWSSGVASIEYVDINNGSALAKLNQSLQYETIDRYINDGVPLALLATIFVEYVEVHRLLMTAMLSEYRRQCAHPAEIFRESCEELARLGSTCTSLWSATKAAILEGSHRFHIIKNRATSEKSFQEFQCFGMLLRMSGFGSDLIESKTYETIKTPEGKRVPVPKSTAYQGIRFQAPDVHAKYRILERTLKPYKNRSPLKIALRSPRGVLSYLGELIALQNFSPDRFVPRIVRADGKTIVVFRVLRGHEQLRDAALSVRGPDRESYFVPLPDYGSETRDQTLRVLAIAGEVVNAAISEKDIPPPTSVVVRAIQ